jgi:hypothetical protein
VVVAYLEEAAGRGGGSGPRWWRRPELEESR